MRYTGIGIVYTQIGYFMVVLIWYNIVYTTICKAQLMELRWSKKDLKGDGTDALIK